MRRANGCGGGIGRWKVSGAPGDGGRGQPLVRRWIGARRRREARAGRAGPGAGAEIVVLTWAQTFGRDPAAAGPGHAPRKGSEGAGGVVILGEGRPRS
ncbi:hypothetical protein [Methylobacterium tarhaniae]|uniref:hypothetical protein n=1 Tax=Methylobacterium tarhaniae TaxID=1187852 RepID=UPI003CFF43CD